MRIIYWLLFLVFYILFGGDLLGIYWAILYEGYSWKIAAPSYYPEYSPGPFYDAWDATVDTRRKIALIVVFSGFSLFLMSLFFLFVSKKSKSKLFRFMLWINVYFIGFFILLNILLLPLRGIRVV